MLDWIGGFLGGLKQTTPVIFLGVAIASGLVLFVGNDLLGTIGLAEFRTEYRAYLGGALVLSLSLVIAHALWGGAKGAVGLVKAALNQRKGQKALEDRQRQLHKLTPDEKAYLAPYILENENTRNFLIEDGVAGGLVAKGILYRASSVGNMLDGWAHNMHAWAREYLEGNPSIFEGATRKRRQSSGRI